MGHVLDMKNATESQILQVRNGGTKLHLSGDNEWVEIIRREGFSSERSVKEQEYHEEFAECVGMLSHLIVEDKSTAVMVLNGEKISLDTWIDRNLEKAEYVCKYLF